MCLCITLSAGRLLSMGQKLSYSSWPLVSDIGQRIMCAFICQLLKCLS